MQRRHDVVILGGGVIGLSCALALLEKSVAVRVIERGAVGSGASHGNCGTITPSHAPPMARPGMIRKALGWIGSRRAPLYIRPTANLARVAWLVRFASRCNWRDFERVARARASILLDSRTRLESWIERHRFDCAFAAAGGLYVYRDAAAFAADAWHAEWLEQLDIVVERKDAAEVAAMEPWLRPDLAGGFFHPGDAHLRPDRYVAELARRVRELGGVIDERTEITGFRVDTGVVLAASTSAGDIAGERFVLALGAWSPRVAHALGLYLPIEPGKGYSIRFDGSGFALARPLSLCEASVCVTSWASGFRLGSTMEFSGFREGLDRVRLAALRDGAARYLKDPGELHVAEEWWGWRPMCVDELPLIGPSRRWGNLHFATGHGMMGMGMSATTGELVAAALTGATPPIDPAPFLPVRLGF